MNNNLNIKVQTNSQSSYYEKILATGEVKCIDDEIPFDLPNGWVWCRIRDISRSYIGLTYKPSDVSQGGTIVLRSSNIQNGKLDLNDIVRVSSDIPEKLWVEKNDIIICARNGSKRLVGKSAIIDVLNEPMTFGAFMAICKTPFYKYIYLFLQSDLFFSQLREVSGTTTINQLTQNNFNGFLVPIPPINEQERIVEFCSFIMPYIERYGIAQDKLDELNINLNPLLRKSILQEAIQGKLVEQSPDDEPVSVLLERIKQEKERLIKEKKIKRDKQESIIYRGDDNKYYENLNGEVIDVTDQIPFDIPKSWQWVRLRALCNIFTGASFKKEEATAQGDNKVRILRGGNILPFRLQLKGDDIFINKHLVNENILLRVNDLVTPAVTSLENICKMARVEQDYDDVTMGGFVFIIRCFYNDTTLAHYLQCVFSSPTTIEFVRSITNKSGQAFYNIGKERLSNTLIPVPPFDEMKRIIARIISIFQQLN